VDPLSSESDGGSSCRRARSRLFRRLFLERLLAAQAADRLKFVGNRVELANPQAFNKLSRPVT
jgi:hypothetical protein